ncbi:MAG: PfkB family carbohydrate kinase [Sphaerochaetaceae bacterium]
MIAVLGEALIDFIAGKDHNGQSCFFYYNGGCALNSATAAARLDSDVVYIGKLSADIFGVQMKEHFKANNVVLLPHLCDVSQNSMIGFATLDAKGSASYTFYIDGTTVTSLSAEEIVAALDQMPEVHYLHIGSVAVALEESGSQILQALNNLENPPFIFFDPNVRPTIISDFASYRHRFLELVKKSDLLKLSHEDLALLFPSLKEAEALNLLLEMGLPHIVLTMGADGLRWLTQDGLDLFVPAIDSLVVDTVGAGDTVSGALLNYLEENGIGKGDPIEEEEITEALEFAAAAADITVSRKGADPPYRSELSSF